MKIPEWLTLLSGDLDDGDGEAVLLLHSQIGKDMFGDGMSSKEFCDMMDAIPSKKSVRLDINTLGGSIPDGTSMANKIRARGNVTTRVVGYAASMGAIIHQAGAKRQMMPGTMFVIHNPRVQANGDQHDHQQIADTLATIKSNMVDMLASRSKLGKRELVDMMDKTTAFDAKAAKEAGLTDEVIDGSPAYNAIDPNELTSICRMLYPATGTAAGTPTANNKNQNKNHMSKLLDTLAKLKVIPSADITEDVAVSHLETNLTNLSSGLSSLTGEVATLKTQLGEHRATLKLRVENKVTRAVDAKVIKAERKDSLIAAGLASEASLDFIDDLLTQAAQPAQGRRSGASPLPVETGDTAANINTLRMELKDSTPTQAAVIARKLRELRGHKDLLAIETERKA